MVDIIAIPLALIIFMVAAAVGFALMEVTYKWITRR